MNPLSTCVGRESAVEKREMQESSFTTTSATCATRTEEPEPNVTKVTESSSFFRYSSSQLPQNCSETTPAKATASSTQRPLLHLPWTGNGSQITQSSVTGSLSLFPTAIVFVIGDGSFSPTSLEASRGSFIAFKMLGHNYTFIQNNHSYPCKHNESFIPLTDLVRPVYINDSFTVKYRVDDLLPKWFNVGQMVNDTDCRPGKTFSLNPRGGHAHAALNTSASTETRASRTDSGYQERNATRATSGVINPTTATSQGTQNHIGAAIFLLLAML